MTAPTPSTNTPRRLPTTRFLAGSEAKQREWGVLPRTLVALSFGVAASATTPAHAQPAKETIYRETFTFCTGSLGKEAAQQTSWLALKSGSLVGRIGFLKVFPYGSLDITGMLNNTPLGYAQGYTFWSKAVYGLSVLTDEFPFQAALLSNPATTIEYLQRLSGVNAAFEANSSHLIFLIDSTWYISDQSIAQANGGVTWEKVSVTPALLTYGTVPLITGRGAEIPATGGQTLPSSGTVRAFGVFLREVNGRVRIDNFTIATDTAAASAFPRTPLDARTDLCPASSPDRGETTPPEATPPANDVEDDTTGTGPNQGVDQQIPDETPPPFLTPGATPTTAATPTPTTTTETPTPIPTPTPSLIPTLSPTTVPYTFCPTAEAGSGKILKPSLTVQKVAQKSVQRSVVGLRNRALAYLLFQKRIPVGSLVNLTRGSYDPLRATITVPVTPTQTMRQIRLNRTSQKLLDLYLGLLTEDTSSQAPLFVTADPLTKAVSPRRAVCLAEIQGIVKRYARVARINTRLIFVGSKR